ncbi:hypothetical protein BGZ83_004659, partial [Gryganskiella cystojenkinii]
WNMFCQNANAAFKDDYQRGLEVCAVKVLDTPDAGFAAIVAPLMEISECAAKADAGVKAQAMISKTYHKALQLPGNRTWISLRSLESMLGRENCDLIMTVEHLELVKVNFELKKAWCTDIKDDI